MTLAEDGSRLESSFTAAWRDAAAGAPASELPAYHWQEPNNHHLAGFLPAAIRDHAIRVIRGRRLPRIRISKAG